MATVLFVHSALPLSSVRKRALALALVQARPFRSPQVSQRTTFISHSRSTNIHESAPPSPPPRVDTVTSLHHDSRPPFHAPLHLFSYASCALLPMLTAAAQPALADDAPPSDPLSFIKGLQGNPLFDKILGITVFVLIIYATIGAIIVSIDGIIIKQNDARQKEWVRKRVDGEPYPKTIWSPELDTEFPPKAGTASSKSGLNREQRRVEKKLQVKEEKEKKRKEAREAAKKKASDDQ